MAKLKIMTNSNTKLARYINFIFMLFVLIMIGCKKNYEANDSGIVVNDIQPKVDNSADSLKLIDYIFCGSINSDGGYWDYDENGKIFYQTGNSKFTSDGSYVYEIKNGQDIGLVECGEEQIEYDSSNSSDNQNVEKQKQWVNCKYCHGSGLKDCYNCSGKGTVSCNNCPGWKDICSICNGKGTYNDCPECEGRGQVLVEF